MKKRRLLGWEGGPLLLVLLLGVFALSGFRGVVEKEKTIKDFSLRDQNGFEVSLASFPDAKGFIIVFSCNHCPFAKLYTARLNELASRFSKQGVPLLVINPMDTVMYEEEGFNNMRIRAEKEHFAFSYLLDATQSVARDFQAKHTPQAYVIWKDNDRWVVRYSGAIDSNGEHPELATPFVVQAVEALLHGEQPKVNSTTTLGCRIQYRRVK